jgi:hypothetical protein
MASEQFLTLGVLVVIVLAAGGVSLPWYRQRVRRQQRQSLWRELCLRLELVPLPANPQVAKGELPETDFLLHDTGSDWLVELPLAQPLLPPGMVLLSPKAPKAWPHIKLRPLQWETASNPPSGLAWYVAWTEPAGKVEVPRAFLDEAARAVQAHAPLRVESRRLIQRLRADTLLSVKEVREAVMALDTTARNWRAVAERHGLPQVQPLSPVQPVQAPPSSEGRLRVLARGGREMTARFLARRRREVSPGNAPPREQAPQPSPPALELLLRLLAQRDTWVPLSFLNGGIPVALGLIWVGPNAVFCILLPCMVASALSVEGIYRNKFLEVRGIWLWLMLWSTTLVAPMLWYYSHGEGSPLTESSVRAATSSSSRTVARHQVSPKLKKYKSPNPIDDAYLERSTSPDAPGKEHRQLALLLWGLPNLLWLGWVLMGWRQELRHFRGSPRVISAEPHS